MKLTPLKNIEDKIPQLSDFYIAVIMSLKMQTRIEDTIFASIEELNMCNFLLDVKLCISSLADNHSITNMLWRTCLNNQKVNR